uniref:Uncharacterized protein n=1 Tax=Arundo donax TaxID=35708 RepID=A0A0A9A092_ARUDO
MELWKQQLWTSLRQNLEAKL